MGDIRSMSASRNFEAPAISSMPNRPQMNGFDTSREAMKSEYERLMTFKSVPPWPVSHLVRPEDCARAGFSYLKQDDKVQCAFCRGVAGGWEPNDDPMEEHRRHFPRCPFICNVAVGNIPIGEEDLPISSILSIDICGPFDPSPLNLGGSDSGRIHGAIPLAGSFEEVASNLSIKTCRGPNVSEMVTPYSRLKSFTELSWPDSTGQDPDKMVEAGFYCTGPGDQVKCFYCGGGLDHWETNDDPWVEHAKWFPQCTYVLLHKGEDFIAEASRDGSEEVELPSSSSSTTSSTNSKNEAGSSRSHISSDDEEMESASAGSDDVAGSSKTSSGVSSGICSPTNGNSDVHESSSSGNSSGEEEEFTISNADNSRYTSSKEKALEEEVRKLREAQQCKVCMDNKVSVVFLPCGHLVSCTDCATAFSKCALCREPIKALVRTYMS